MINQGFHCFTKSFPVYWHKSSGSGINESKQHSFSSCVLFFKTVMSPALINNSDGLSDIILVKTLLLTPAQEFLTSLDSSLCSIDANTTIKLIGNYQIFLEAPRGKWSSLKTWFFFSSFFSCRNEIMLAKPFFLHQKTQEKPTQENNYLDQTCKMDHQKNNYNNNNLICPSGLP